MRNADERVRVLGPGPCAEWNAVTQDDCIVLEHAKR